MPLRSPLPYHGTSYHDLLVVSTELSQSSLPHSCCSFYLDSFLYLANSYTSFRPRPSTIYHLPRQVSLGPQFGLSAPPSPHLTPMLSEHLVHFSLPLLKSHHTILEVSTDMSVSRWHLLLEGRSQVSFIWVLLASRTVFACNRHSLHVYWSKQNGDKEGERIPTISSFAFGPLVTPFQGFWAPIAHLWLLLLSNGTWDLLFKRVLGRIFRELFQTQPSWDR